MTDQPTIAGEALEPLHELRDKLKWLCHYNELWPLIEAALARTPSAREAWLEEALSFYADEARWQMNSSGVTSALDDRGFRARQALGGRNDG